MLEKFGFRVLRTSGFKKQGIDTCSDGKEEKNCIKRYGKLRFALK